MELRYLDYETRLGDGAVVADTAAVIGRMVAGARLTLCPYATLRADGEHIRIGDDVYFGEHATAHIVDARIGTTVGDGITVGRYGVVHGCTLSANVIVGEGSAVMDDASVGADAVIAADSIVSPGKKLAGRWLYQGIPAQPVREISRAEADAIARSIRTGDPPALVRSSIPHAPSAEVPSSRGDRSPAPVRRSPSAYVAPTACIEGDVRLGEDAGVYFGCVVSAGDGHIVIGPRTNVQDNSFLFTSKARGDLVLGVGATVGHNVQMGSGTFGDDCLIGMMSRVADGVIVEAGGCIAAGAWVEPGTIVKAGWIWAGRPARPFREIRPAERAEFARARDVYIRYGAAYRSEA
jgi:carbonic anhydrase/acetyltransferase-like protein (isoleucine patch superfamily)